MEGVSDLVNEDLAKLRAANVKPTAGDIRCIVYGHLIRLAIWNLRQAWDKNADINKRLSAVSSWLQRFGVWTEIEKHLGKLQTPLYDAPLYAVGENHEKCGAAYAEISF
jgi:hypothetical protein